jgi:membrane associated rhomboid family serine protease
MFQLPPLPPISPFQRQVAFVIAAAFVLIELTLQASDIGLFAPDLRWRVYEKFAFFTPWFEAWLAGDPAPVQVRWSLLTHAFLHSGMTHLVMNTGVFLALAFVTLRVFGTAWFLAIFVVSAIAGAVFFGLISHTAGVLVGASGAVFGLIGAIKFFEIGVIRAFGGSWPQYWRVIGALVLINVLLAIGLGGLLAWQAHLGGFVGGFLTAAVFRLFAAPSA